MFKVHTMVDITAEQVTTGCEILIDAVKQMSDTTE